MKALLLFLTLFPLTRSSGQSSPLGGLPGAPLRLGFGSQGIGLGNAMIATPTRFNTGYYNPALVAFQAHPQVSASVGLLSLDRGLNFLNFSTHVPPSAGLSIGIINAGVSEIEGRDSDGRKTETFSTSENSFLMSFGVHLDTKLTLGVSTKILYYSLYKNLSSTTANFDVGLVYRLSDELTAGAVLQDIGAKYKWDSSKLYGLQGNSTTEHFPIRKRIGASYAPSSTRILAAAELEHIAGTVLMRFGAEFMILDSFALRAGLDQIGSRAERPSLGFTLQTSVGKWESFLSYAFVLEPYAPGTFHMITVAMEFQ